MGRGTQSPTLSPALSAPGFEDKKSEVEEATENELSEAEEELSDSQQTPQLSELYATTVPSLDSAMDSWDGSGLDAGYGSQGRSSKRR